MNQRYAQVLDAEEEKFKLSELLYQPSCKRYAIVIKFSIVLMLRLGRLKKGSMAFI